jgi:solute carrier family 25 protein 34/35
MQDFWLGGISATTAITICNPFDVAKTRMQLQGELTGGGKGVYRNVPHAIFTIARNEGLAGLQRGLVAGACFQFALTSTRFGIFGAAKEMTAFDTRNQPPHRVFLTSFGLAAAASFLGAAVSSPFWLIKTRMQAQSDSQLLSKVGYQHKYTSFTDAFATIYRQEGFGGLFKNVEANIIRLVVSGSVQLAAYETSKGQLLKWGYEEGVKTHVMASLVTGVVVVSVWQPFDTTACRLMNQGSNKVLYKSFSDCFYKTWQAEGVVGLYKGVFAQYSRICPYTVLTFVIFEQLKRLAGGETKRR